MSTEYHDIFLLFDTVGDNKIAGAQLGEVLRAMGQNPTESDVRKCLKDRNVRLSFEQFLPILTGISKTRPHNTLEEFTEGFKVRVFQKCIHLKNIRYIQNILYKFILFKL